MIKRKQNIISILLLVLFTFSNLGFSYASPCCESKEEKEVIQASDSCCEVKVKKEKPNCCEEEEKKEHICNNDCDGLCFSTFTYYKLDLDQISNEIKLFSSEIISERVIYYIKDESVELKLVNHLTNKSPPKLWGRSLIISLHQPKLPSPLTA